MTPRLSPQLGKYFSLAILLKHACVQHVRLSCSKCHNIMPNPPPPFATLGFEEKVAALEKQRTAEVLQARRALTVLQVGPGIPAPDMRCLRSGHEQFKRWYNSTNLGNTRRVSGGSAVAVFDFCDVVNTLTASQAAARGEQFVWSNEPYLFCSYGVTHRAELYEQWPYAEFVECAAGIVFTAGYGHVDRRSSRQPYIDVEEDERGALVIWGDKGVVAQLLRRQCVLFDAKIENIEQVMRRGVANSFGLLVSVGRKSRQWIPDGWQDYQANIPSMWFHRFLEMTSRQQQLPPPFVSAVHGSPRSRMARSLPPQQVLPAECVHGRGQSQRPRHRAARGSREVHLPARLPLQVWHRHGHKDWHYAPY